MFSICRNSSKIGFGKNSVCIGIYSVLKGCACRRGRVTIICIYIYIDASTYLCIHLSIYLCVCLSVCLFVYLYLSAYLCIYIGISIPISTCTAVSPQEQTRSAPRSQVGPSAEALGPQYGPLIWTPIHINDVPRTNQGPTKQIPPESKGPITRVHRTTLGLGGCRLVVATISLVSWFLCGA